MHLLLLNGSPKGKSSNSNYLLHLFTEGFDETPGHTREFANLADGEEKERLVELFAKADAVVFAFPLAAMYVTDFLTTVAGKTPVRELGPYDLPARAVLSMGFVLMSISTAQMAREASGKATDAAGQGSQA